MDCVSLTYLMCLINELGTGYIDLVSIHREHVEDLDQALYAVL